MNTETLVKNIISKHKGAVHKQRIARESKMSLDYVDLICRDLERKGEIVFSGGFYALPKARKSASLKTKSGPDTRKASFSLSDIPGVAADLSDTLKEAGYATIESLAEAPIAKLMQETKVQLNEAARLINYARKVLGQIKDTEVEEEGAANSNESSVFPREVS